MTGFSCIGISIEQFTIVHGYMFLVYADCFSRRTRKRY
jgi:hypothetical protein